MKFIGLSGKCRSGKTTVANELVNYANDLGYKGHVISIASWIKLLAARGLDRTDREALQLFGFDVIHEGVRARFGVDDFWAKLVMQDMIDLKKEGYDWFVCDDIRTIPELLLFQKYGFYIARLKTTFDYQVSRAGGNNMREYTLEQSYHSTELAGDIWEGKGKYDIEFEPEVIIKEIVNGILPIAFDGQVKRG